MKNLRLKIRTQCRKRKQLQKNKKLNDSCIKIADSFIKTIKTINKIFFYLDEYYTIDVYIYRFPRLPLPFPSITQTISLFSVALDSHEVISALARRVVVSSLCVKSCGSDRRVAELRVL